MTTTKKFNTDTIDTSLLDRVRQHVDYNRFKNDVLSNKVHFNGMETAFENKMLTYLLLDDSQEEYEMPISRNSH